MSEVEKKENKKRKNEKRPTEGNARREKNRPMTGSARQEKIRPAAGSTRQEKVRPATGSMRREKDRPMTGSARQEKIRPAAGHMQREKICPAMKRCGGCSLLDMTYEEQLKCKEDFVRKELKGIVKPEPILGMENPWHYRNKIHASFARKRDGSIVSGIYEEGTHRLVPVENCLIQDERANRIVRDLCGLFESFRIKVYNEDTGYGLVRHVLIRTGHVSGEVMVVLVCVSPVFPSKRNFVNALRKLHPEVTTVVLSVD